jgi:adhesin HecA-like repeat protein
MAARAEAGFARGLAAQESGAAVEALLNYSQAVAFDPSQMESLARLGSISQEIGGGSVSMDIINDIQARNAWLAAFKETAAFFNSHPPFEITYDPNLLQIGVTDYAKNQADLAMRIRVAPSEAGFTALNALLEGLEKTGRRELWGFAGWPFLDIRPKAPETTLFPGQRSFSFAVQTALVNENGKVIARGNLTLETGEITFKAGDTAVTAPEGALGQVLYPKVNANVRL